MKRLIPLASVLVAFVLALAGCPAADNPAVTYPAVVTADVNTAGGAFKRSWDASLNSFVTNVGSLTPTGSGNTTTYNYTSSDGTIHFIQSMTVVSSVTTNMSMSVTLSGLLDSSSGYTISGTITLNYDLSSDPAGMTIVMDLNFSGTGPVQKLTMNASGTQTIVSGAPSGATTMTSSTITCNGKSFTPADIGL